MSRSAKSSQGKSEVAPISLILYFVMVLSTLAQGKYGADIGGGEIIYCGVEVSEGS